MSNQSNSKSNSIFLPLVVMEHKILIDDVLSCKNDVNMLELMKLDKAICLDINSLEIVQLYATIYRPQLFINCPAIMPPFHGVLGIQLLKNSYIYMQIL